jgi:hypothetical protein
MDMDILFDAWRRNIDLGYLDDAADCLRDYLRYRLSGGTVEPGLDKAAVELTGHLLLSIAAQQGTKNFNA